jgi:diguanylate cyclase (GGDEF) domain
MAANLNVRSSNVNPSLRRRSDLPPDPPSEPIRVLIAEDDENFSFWLASIARRLGLVVTRAADGEEAFEKLCTRFRAWSTRRLRRSGEFDLLVADFDMPKKDGLELIVAVRAEPRTSGLYAVMLTAHDRPDVKVKALTLGYDDFLAKSCSEVEVVAKVAAACRMLGRQRALDADARLWRGIANQDELTKVATRRFFFEQADRRIAEKHDVGVVLIDVDDFKTINDTYGHLTGDRVLKDIGALFLRRTRSDDVIARYGGDEFVLLVLNLSVEETRFVAGRLTAELSSLQWGVGEATLHISVTMGIGCSELIENATMEGLLDAADRELYAMKWLRKHPSATAPDTYLYPAKTTDVVQVSEIAPEIKAGSAKGCSSGDRTPPPKQRPPTPRR